MGTVGKPKFEDKAAIVKSLLPALQSTRAYEHITSLEYVQDWRMFKDGKDHLIGEFAVVKQGDVELFKIDITADSGICILNDIIRYLYCKG